MLCRVVNRIEVLYPGGCLEAQAWIGQQRARKDRIEFRDAAASRVERLAKFRNRIADWGNTSEPRDDDALHSILIFAILRKLVTPGDELRSSGIVRRGGSQCLHAADNVAHCL